MNVDEFPSEIIKDAHHVVQGFCSKSDHSKELQRLWAWLETDGYNIIADLYTDWVVADLNQIAYYHFTDSEILDHIDSTDINNSDRVEFARNFLDFDSADDSLYPSPISIELATKNKKATIGVLMHPQGQAGLKPELFGIFSDEEEFKDALRSRLYIQVIPAELEPTIKDAELIELWRD